MTVAAPLVGIGYRHQIGDWIRAYLDRFDVLEVTVEHFFYGGPHVRAALEAISRRRPIVAHGVGLSLGTDAPLDGPYVREVAEVVRRLGASRYSEHLAFTKVPGLDLGNLLPLPKTPEVAEFVADKVRRVRALMPVPFDLENIAYMFDWPDSAMSDGAFLRAVCAAGGAGILLDVENVHVNAHNHGFDADAALAEIPAARVHGFHMAGGCRAGALLVDSHDHAVPEGALALLGPALGRFRPATIVLERDDRIDAFDEILADVARIRACVAARPAADAPPAPPPPQPVHRPSPIRFPLIERQRAVLAFLTDPSAARDAAPLAGVDGMRLDLVRELSLGKRLEKVEATFPVTLAHLDEPFAALGAAFAAEFPPYDIGRAENARQFRDFLVARWRRTPPARAWLPDLLAIELALALARRQGADGAAIPAAADRPAVRRLAGAQFLHCRYGVQELFDPDEPAAEPMARDTWLVVLPPASGEGTGAAAGRVIEVSPDLYAALRTMDEWRPLRGEDPLGIGAPAELAERLFDLGVLEVAA